MIERAPIAWIYHGIPLAVFGGLLWPILYALWISFTPHELLIPPTTEWSLRWYVEFFSQSQWANGLWHSLIVAAMACILSVVSGTGAALAAARYHFRGREWLAGAVMLPLFIPALVVGMSLLPMMRAIGLWGTYLSVAAAHSLWGLPLVFLAVRGALEDADPDLESAAAGLGAGKRQTFVFVTLPLIAPAIAAGAMMTFIVSLNELMMAIFLCTPGIETLPKVIWPNLRYTLNPVIAAASTISMLATILPLAAVGLLRRVRFY